MSSIFAGTYYIHIPALDDGDRAKHTADPIYIEELLLSPSVGNTNHQQMH